MSIAYFFCCDFLRFVDITGGPAALDEYKFLQFHMHWGTNENEGSEHVIDGIRFPAEVNNPSRFIGLKSYLFNSVAYRHLE